MEINNFLFILALYTTTVYSVLLFTLPLSHGDEDGDRFKKCEQSYSCGELSNITYPFYGNGRPDYCGYPGFQLNCIDEKYSSIVIRGQEFRVLNISSSSSSSSYKMTLARTDLFENPCSSIVYNVTEIDPSRFSFAQSRIENITINYGCQLREDPNTGIPTYNYNYTCGEQDGVTQYTFYEVTGTSGGTAWSNCRYSTVVPVNRNPMTELGGGKDALIQAVDQGFDVNYYAEWSLCVSCLSSSGHCGSDEDSVRFSCICETGQYNQTCPPASRKDNRTLIRIAVGVGSGVGAVLLMSIVLFFYLRRYKKRNTLIYTNSQSLSSDPSNIISRDIEKGSRLFGVHLFKYEELEEATDNFNPSKELGDGGFGTVYHGKLHDGREVAVKRLYENNYRRIEQFMNEVQILARLNHPNLVTLYGCTSRHSRELLLVCEYISNGTVADHLHGEKANPCILPWRIRMDIAIETASALAHLHASDIIHRDVKTNNILLDKNFGVKVADFGLSRLFPTDITHISTAPQGTPGYVDPEYRVCYQLTEKSDVYSFGVVLVELISSKPAVDITRHRHEINLSSMALNKIPHGALDELVDPCLGFESNLMVRKMINAVAEVAFRCLQGEKGMRPSMLEVFESLKDIKNNGHGKGHPEEMDIREDAAVSVLLKNEPPPFSPNSIASNLRSSSTTPYTSG